MMFMIYVILQCDMSYVMCYRWTQQKCLFVSHCLPAVVTCGEVWLGLRPAQRRFSSAHLLQYHWLWTLWALQQETGLRHAYPGPSFASFSIILYPLFITFSWTV